MTISVTLAVAGTANGLGEAGSVVTSGVNALVAGGVAAAVGGGGGAGTADFLDLNNSGYAMFPVLGLGVN